MRILVILTLVLNTSAAFAQSYDELSNQLNAAKDKAEIHRLKSQLASAGMQRLESEDLSKAEQKKLKAESRSLCSDVQLGAMDIWFGDSVVIWARLHLLDGNWHEARSLLLGQAEVLENIEKNLAANQIPVSSISPLAGCRYFLGETYRIEYEENDQLEPAAEALKHYYNVYIKYGNSPWGERAKQKADGAKVFIESLGKQVRIELGSHRTAFVVNKLKLGRRLIAEGNHAEAFDPILDAINFFPETGKSAAALRNLGICFLNLDRYSEMMMTVEYLCERFNADTNAPSAVLGIGRKCIDAGDEITGEQIFDFYLTSFPSDSHRADILSYFAWKSYKAEQWVAADRYFEQVVELNGSVKAQHARADCAMKSADWKTAAAHFKSLETLLRDSGEFGAPLEKAVYFQGYCSKDPVAYDRFLSEFPDSGLAPRALGEKAQSLLVAGEFDAAFQTMELLSERYPEALSARAALAGLIVAAVEAQRFDIASQVLDRMLTDKQTYGYNVYIRTGKTLLSAEQFKLAEKAFEAVPLNAQRKFIETALQGKAAAQFGQARFEESYQTLDALIAKYPTTGWFYDARIMQGRALAKLGRTAEAIDAYGEVVAAKEDYTIVFEMAQLMTDPEDQLAAYQRIALLANPDKLEDRPLIAESIVVSLPLCFNMQKYQVAIDSCDQFENLFPEHDQLPTIFNYRKEAEHALAQ
ncbi:MAG: tetratricopeptide repeat protein [Pontiella sp.]